MRKRALVNVIACLVGGAALAGCELIDEWPPIGGGTGSGGTRSGDTRSGGTRSGGTGPGGTGHWERRNIGERHEWNIRPNRKLPATNWP